MPSKRIPILVAPTVEGVDPDDPDGHIPVEYLASGIVVVVPLWPNPAGPGRTDSLQVKLRRGTPNDFDETTKYNGPVTQPEFRIPIAPSYLQGDGDAYVYYIYRNFADNPLDSFERKLTIDHGRIIADLDEAKFPQADELTGYINCNSVPPMWNGINVVIPPLLPFRINDVCEMEWLGYLSANGSGSPVSVTRKVVRKRISTEAERREGFTLTVEPFVPHIEPMKERASAAVVYTIFRGAKRVGVSKRSVVKVDRVRTGVGYCPP